MKTIKVDQLASGYDLLLSDAEYLICGPHDIRIEVKAAGVNHADIYQAQGSYPAPEGASNVLGLEVSGVILEIGEKVRSHAVGDKVCALLQSGGYASEVVVREWRALAIPANCSFEQAAALPEALFTVYHNILDVGALSPQKSILIHGGTSGIGVYAVQVASLFGKHVFTTVGKEEKKAFFNNYANVTAINYYEEDFVEIIKKSCGSLDMVLDMVGGSYIQRNMKVLKKYGKLISIAFIAGAKQEINCAPLLMKNLTWTGTTIRSKSEEEIYDLAQSVFSTLWPLIEQEQILPVIDNVYPLSEAKEAHNRMESSQHIGKIILCP